MKKAILFVIIFFYAYGCKSNTDFEDLNEAVCNGNIEKVKLLINSGIDINIRGINGESLIENAIKMNHIDLTEYLLNSGADFDNKIVNQALRQNGDEKLIKLINSYSLQLLNVNSSQILNKIDYYKGKKAVMLNVWALWCKPCVEEFPMVASLDSEYDELEIFFINTDFEDQRKEVEIFLKSQNIIGESYFKVEKDERFINALSEAWNGTLPFTIAYSKSSGDIVDFWVGIEPELRFRSAINKAISL